MTSETIKMHPIGVVRTDIADIPRHWSVSRAEGILEIDHQYRKGLKDIRSGQKIVVLFCFDRSEVFHSDLLVQHPKHKDRETGVFSLCSPRRPNPIGLSVVEVIAVVETGLGVRGIDMMDGTPILDIKPHVTGG